MGQGISTFIFPVKDLTGAKELYSKLLGIAPYVDEPYYVGFRAGDEEIGLDPNGRNQGMTGPIAYWDVSDIEDSLQTLLVPAHKFSNPSKTSVEGSSLRP
jgi:hypothetical protein